MRTISGEATASAPPAAVRRLIADHRECTIPDSAKRLAKAASNG